MISCQIRTESSDLSERDRVGTLWDKLRQCLRIYEQTETGVPEFLMLDSQ